MPRPLGRLLRRGALGVRLRRMLSCRLGVLLSFLGVLIALRVVALAMMLGRGAMGLGRVFVMLSGFRM